MAYTFKTYLYNEKLSKEQNLIMDKLYKLRMSGMAEALEQPVSYTHLDVYKRQSQCSINR